MRKLIWIMLAVIALQACDNKKNAPVDAYNMKVNLQGSEGKWLKLLARVDRNYVTYDSAFVEAGAPAVLSKGIDVVTTMYLTVEDTNGSIQLLVENSNYSIDGTMDDPNISTDSKAQNDLNDYNEKLRPGSEKLSAMDAELRRGPDSEDPEAYTNLRQAYDALSVEQNELRLAYVTENPSSFASVLALRNTFYMLDAENLETTLNSLDTPLQEMEEYKYMYGKMERMMAVAIGKKYADFGLETPEGELLKVSDVHQGNVLLIDFWASWCSPCRRANPEVVKIYHSYHDQGFEILGVSLDRDSARWVQAISDDQLSWKHVSDLKYWNSAGAVLYGVPAIPHTVLIDREGIIRAKNLEGEELREAIEALL